MNNMMKYISFTKNETKVILFIVAVLVAGFSIKYYKQIVNGAENEPYDFTSSDTEFKRLSENAIKNGSSKEKSDSLNNSDRELINSLQRKEDSLTSGINSKKESGDIPGKIININTATRNELIDLPGIGESTADKIISYRDAKKGFRKIEELMNVSGIGKKKFEKIKSFIKTE